MHLMDMMQFGRDIGKSVGRVISGAIRKMFLFSFIGFIIAITLVVIAGPNSGGFVAGVGWVVAALLIIIGSLGGLIIGAIRGLKGGAKEVFLKNQIVIRVCEEIVKTVIERIGQGLVDTVAVSKLKEGLKTCREKLEGVTPLPMEAVRRGIISRVKTRLASLPQAGIGKAVGQLGGKIEQLDLKGKSSAEVSKELSAQLPRMVDAIVERSIDELFARPLLLAQGVAGSVFLVFFLIMVLL